MTQLMFTSGPSVAELKRLKKLEAENVKLKRMYAELALVRHHDRAHLVKQELVGDTAEPRDSLLQPGGQ